MAEWPANGEEDWNTLMKANIDVGHDSDGTHKKSQMLTDMNWSPTTEVDNSSSTGVTVIPNVLRIARGQESINGSSAGTVTPSGFTKIYHANAIIVEDSNTDRNANVKLGKINDTTFTIRNTSSNTLSYSWFCIGR